VGRKVLPLNSARSRALPKICSKALLPAFFQQRTAFQHPFIRGRDSKNGFAHQRRVVGRLCIAVASLAVLAACDRPSPPESMPTPTTTPMTTPSPAPMKNPNADPGATPSMTTPTPMPTASAASQ